MSDGSRKSPSFFDAKPIPAIEVLICRAIGEAIVETPKGESITVRAFRSAEGVLTWTIIR